MVYTKAAKGEKIPKKERFVKRLQVRGVNCPGRQFEVNKAKDEYGMLVVACVVPGEKGPDGKEFWPDGKELWHDVQLATAIGEVIRLGDPKWRLIKELDDKVRNKEFPLMDIQFYEKKDAYTDKSGKLVGVIRHRASAGDVAAWKYA